MLLKQTLMGNRIFGGVAKHFQTFSKHFPPAKTFHNFPKLFLHFLVGADKFKESGKIVTKLHRVLCDPKYVLCAAFYCVLEFMLDLH